MPNFVDAIMQTATPSDNSVVDAIIRIESGGDATVKNPRSSATGLGQFIKSTWDGMVNTFRPDLREGRTRAEVYALRNDPAVAREMVTHYANQNTVFLQNRGVPVNEVSLYLAHFLGPATAASVLKKDPNVALSTVLKSSVLKANPFLKKMTISGLQSWANRKMTGGGVTVTGGASGGGSVIGKGSPKEDVSSLQAALKVAGFDPGQVDGVFGKRTEAAVRAFQQAAGLSMVDGKAGKQTLGALQQKIAGGAVGQVFGSQPSPAFTGNLPRPRPSISPLSPGSTDYVSPASRIAGAFAAAQDGPPTIAPANRPPAVSMGPLRGSAVGAVGQGASVSGGASRPITVNQPPQVSYTPFASRAPSSTNYTGGGPTSGPTPSAWGAGSNVSAAPMDRAAIGINTPQQQSSDLTKTRLAAIERQRQLEPAYQSPPPSVGAGLTTPFGVKSPEAFASSRPPPQSGFDAIMGLLGSSKAQAAPRAQTLNFTTSPAPAPMWDGGFVEQPGAVTGPVNQAPSLVRTQIEKAVRSGIMGGRVDHALSISGGNPKAAWDALGPNATQNEIAQMSQRLGSMPRAPTITGGAALPARPPSPSSIPPGTFFAKPTPVKTQSFMGPALPPQVFSRQPAALPGGEFDARFAVGGAPTISMGQQPFDIAQQKISQLKSAQPPAPPQIAQQKGVPTTASRAAGPLGFSPQVAAMQKSLRDAGVTDYQGNKLTVDGLMGARTLSAMQKAGISPVGGGGMLASQGVRSGAPSINQTTTGGASSGSSVPSVSSGRTTPSGVSYSATDNAGRSYGTSGYGTGVRGY